MVTKKKPAKRAAPRAAPKKRATRRNKSGITRIPDAAATVGLVVANAGLIGRTLDKVSSDGIKAIPNLVMGSGSDYKWLRQQFIKPEQLVKDAVGVAGGYVAGEIAKKYAPGFIKRPMGKIAKKIPKVF